MIKLFQELRWKNSDRTATRQAYSFSSDFEKQNGLRCLGCGVLGAFAKFAKSDC